MIKAYNAKQWEIPLLQDGRKTVTRRIVKCGKSYPGYHDRDKFYGIVDHLNNDHKNWYAGFYNDNDVFLGLDGEQHIDALYWKAPCKPGDILYIRETWQCWRAHRYESTADIRFRAGGEGVQIQFANGNSDSVNRCEYDEFVTKWHSYHGEWRPSIHMPKEAARIWLKVTAIRVERLQKMEIEDALAEGITPENRDRGCSCQFAVDGCTERPCANRDAYDYERHINPFMKLWDSTIKPADRDHYGWKADPWVWVIEFERCEKPEPCILAGMEPAEDKRPCMGYGTEQSDEPCEMCKGCNQCTGNDDFERCEKPENI